MEASSRAADTNSSWEVCLQTYARPHTQYAPPDALIHTLSYDAQQAAASPSPGGGFDYQLSPASTLARTSVEAICLYQSSSMQLLIGTYPTSVLQ